MRHLVMLAVASTILVLAVLSRAPDAPAQLDAEYSNTLNVFPTYLGPEVVISGEVGSALGIPDLNVTIEDAITDGPPIFDGPPTTALLPPVGIPEISWRVPLTLAPGSYRVTVVASMAGEPLFEQVELFEVVDQIAPAIELIAAGASWAYYDAGDEPAPGGDDIEPYPWHDPRYDVALWKQGPAELGYGDGDEATETSELGAFGQKILTQYFRHTFAPGDLADFDTLVLSLLRDDGAVVYLNGIEVARSNMPVGPVSYGTPAASVSEQTVEITLAAADLVDGANVLAVEIHQSSATSSDLSFRAALVAMPSNTPRTSDNTEGTLVLTAGDMARCNFDGDTAVAGQMGEIFDNDSGVFLALGDLAYNDGTIAQFANCYDPTIGQFKNSTWPSPGNHEHYTPPNAAGYREYFGPAAGPFAGPNGGLWYSFDINDDWHVIGLDSDCRGREVLPGAVDGDGCAVGSDQEVWLRGVLEANKDKNLLAFFHHPPYTNNRYTDHEFTFPLWRALAEYGTDVTLHGHEHHYERYGQLDYWGQRDERFGIREFIIGSGGTNPRCGERPAKPESDYRGTFPFGTNDFGVLQLWLRPDGYEWKWESIYGLAATDTGVSGLTDAMPRSAITGTVTDRISGAALADVLVCATASRTQVESCATSGADGRWQIEPLVTDRYAMSVLDAATEYSDPREGASVALVAPSNGAIDLDMIPRASISGAVVADLGGAPIAGALVCASDMNSDAFNCANTDGVGAYEIESLPFGDYEIEIAATGFVAECYDNRSDCELAMTIPLRGVDVLGIDASLETAPARISGSAFNRQGGAPVGGITVCASSPSIPEPACAVTQADGFYEIGGLSTGNYVVRFSDPQSRFLTQCYRDRVCTRPRLVGVIQPGIRRDINAALSPAPPPTPTPSPPATVVATATPTSTPVVTPTAVPTSTLTPVPTPTLTAVPTSTAVPTPTLTAVPTSTPVPVPTPTLTAVPTSTPVPTPTLTAVPTPTSTAIPPTAEPTPPPVPTVVALPRTINGQVTVLATGAPVFAAEVCAVRGFPAAELCVFSDLNGRFSIDNLATGNYTVIARDVVGRYLPSCAGGLTCDAPFLFGISASQGVTSADIELDPIFTSGVPTPTPVPSAEGTIAGVVTRNGQPVAGVQVCAISIALQNASCATTALDGSYLVEGLRTGNYRIEFDGAAMCYRQRVGCASYTPVGLVSPGARTGIDANL